MLRKPSKPNCGKGKLKCVKQNTFASVCGHENFSFVGFSVSEKASKFADLISKLLSDLQTKTITRTKNQRSTTQRDDVANFEKLLEKLSMSSSPTIDVKTITKDNVFEVFKSYVLGLDDMYYSNVVNSKKNSYQAIGNPALLCVWTSKVIFF